MNLKFILSIICIVFLAQIKAAASDKRTSSKKSDVLIKKLRTEFSTGLKSSRDKRQYQNQPNQYGGGGNVPNPFGNPFPQQQFGNQQPNQYGNGQNPFGNPFGQQQQQQQFGNQQPTQFGNSQPFGNPQQFGGNQQAAPFGGNSQPFGSPQQQGSQYGSGSNPFNQNQQIPPLQANSNQQRPGTGPNQWNSNNQQQQTYPNPNQWANPPSQPGHHTQTQHPNRYGNQWNVHHQTQHPNRYGGASGGGYGQQQQQHQYGWIDQAMNQTNNSSFNNTANNKPDPGHDYFYSKSYNPYNGQTTRRIPVTPHLFWYSKYADISVPIQAIPDSNYRNW